MLARLKEGREHGSDLFPLDTFDQRAQAGCDIGYIHWHDEVEWVYVAEGAIDVFEDGSTRRARAGELFAVEPRTLHRYSAVSDCRLFVIVFDGGLLEFAQADVASRRYIDPYRAGTLTVRNPVRDEDGTIGAAFEQILADCRDLPPCFTLDVRICLLRIFQEIVRTGSLVENERDRHSLAAAERAVRYVQDHYAEQISSATLAQVSGYQPQYFSRFFKRATGLTPTAFINRYRIERACDELLDTDRSIIDIGLSCGFQSTSYFIKKFKEFKEVSPQRYRKTVLGSYRANREHYQAIEVGRLRVEDTLAGPGKTDAAGDQQVAGAR